MAYLDTSVLAAYYCPEPLSTAVQRRLGRAEAFAISPLVEVEFHSALAAKVRTGDLAAVAAARVRDLFRQHLADNCYGFLSIGAPEYALARDWLGQFSTPLRALDAIHLATAYINGLAILTTDKGLARAATHFGVRSELIA